MKKIIQTPQQRANTLEAINVMWPSVPPENVARRLGGWKVGSNGEPPSCGTIACFGGWCAWWPPFVDQGVSADSWGRPRFGETVEYPVARVLFGAQFLFRWRGGCVIDEGFTGTDHELVTHRLQWLLDNSEVRG